MSSYTPQVIRTYWTVLHGQEVEVRVFSEGGTLEFEDDYSEEEQIEEITQQLPDATGRDLTKILKDIELYVTTKEDEDTED